MHRPPPEPWGEPTLPTGYSPGLIRNLAALTSEHDRALADLARVTSDLAAMTGDRDRLREAAAAEDARRGRWHRRWRAGRRRALGLLVALIKWLNPIVN